MSDPRELLQRALGLMAFSPLRNKWREDVRAYLAAPVPAPPTEPRVPRGWHVDVPGIGESVYWSEHVAKTYAARYPDATVIPLYAAPAAEPTEAMIAASDVLSQDHPIAIAARLTASPHCATCRDMREHAAGALIALAVHAPPAEPCDTCVKWRRLAQEYIMHYINQTNPMAGIEEAAIGAAPAAEPVAPNVRQFVRDVLTTLPGGPTDEETVERVSAKVARALPPYAAEPVAQQPPPTTEYRRGLEDARIIALEQRCERGTPWDMACTIIAKKIAERTNRIATDIDMAGNTNPPDFVRHTVQQPPPDSDAMQRDLAEILRTVGLSDSACPRSPHEVVQRKLLPRLRELIAAQQPKAPTLADDLVARLTGCAENWPEWTIYAEAAARIESNAARIRALTEQHDATLLLYGDCERELAASRERIHELSGELKVATLGQDALYEQIHDCRRELAASPTGGEG